MGGRRGKTVLPSDWLANKIAMRKRAGLGIKHKIPNRRKRDQSSHFRELMAVICDHPNADDAADVGGHNWYFTNNFMWPLARKNVMI